MDWKFLENIAGLKELAPTMSEESKKLIVEDLPRDITEDNLRNILENKKRGGAGPIENVELRENGDTCFAIITFKECDAVDLVLSKGDTVTINDVEAKVKRFDSWKSKAKTKTHKKYSRASTLTSDDDDDDDTSENATKRKQSTTSDSDEDTEEDPQQPWERTIMAKVIDVTRSKDFYQLYFEDKQISQGLFYENSLMLDCLNKHIYVTFHSRKAAIATCRFKHKPDSNLSEVNMATKEDFDIYNNLLSVHGDHPISTAQEKKELKDKIKKHARMEVMDVLQYDEPRSVIVMFDPDSCGDINAATWISVECGGTRLIVAPVFKTKCVKVTGLNPLSLDSTICRFFSNEKLSGGGEVAAVSRPNKGECIVTFKAENSVSGVAKKDDHYLEGSYLNVSFYHSCLSKDVYKQQIKPMRQQFMKLTQSILQKPVQSPYKEIMTPVTQRQTPHPELRCAVDQFCSSYKIKCNNEKLQCIFKLCKFGVEFLASREQILIEIMHSANCKHNLSLNGGQSVMTIHLDWPEKTSDKKVREMLYDGVEQALDYMNSFRMAQFNIDRFEINEFQKFYLRCHEELPDKLYYDYQDNVAVFISNRDENWIKGKVNSFYHKFLSDRNGQLDASGYGDEEMSDTKDDDIESDNAWQQKPRGPNNGVKENKRYEKRVPFSYGKQRYERFEESKVQKSAKKATEKKLSTASDSNDDTDEEDSQQLWERTIKAIVINVRRSKDFYQLYFEDSHIFQGSFDENSLTLDGLNKHIYVTFNSRKAALATCRFKHKPDSNLSKVEMATEEDFNTYGNLLSVHGEYPISTAREKKELKEKIRNSARMEVLDVLQYDEPRSAIIMFDPDSCGDISAATWISVECGGTRLIVAPVFKTKCVKVTGLNPLSLDSTICRYFSNEKLSGGGEVAAVSQPNKGECIVTFKAENSVDGVIKKGGHVLEGSDLKVSLYHLCLSKDVYKQQIMKYDRKHCTETSCHKQPQSQTPLKHRQTSHPELKCVVVPLCSSSKLDHNNKNFQYTLELCKFGFQFLKSREQILNEMMHSANCKHTLTLNESQGVMTIHLDYQIKVTAQVVKDMLKSGANKMLNYMNNFRTALFIIDKSEINGFQKFYLKYSQELPDVLYFDHQDNVAVFISDCDENWMKGMVNSFYHKFLSDGDGLLGASGYSDEEMSSIKDDDFESDNPCRQNSRGPDNRRPYSAAQRKKAPPTHPPKPKLTNRCHSKKEEGEEENDKHWAIVDEEIFEEKDVILFQFTNFHEDIEKKYQPLKIIIDAQKHSVIIKSDTKSKTDTVKLKLFKKARDFRSRNIESIFSQQQKELLMKQNVQDKINKEFKEKNFLAQVKCTADAVTLYYNRGVEDYVLKKIVESYVV